MPGAALHHSRIGLDETKCGKRQPEQGCGNLRVARLVSLAVRLCAEDQRDPAVLVEADVGRFVRRATRRFEKASDAEAAQPAAFRRSGSPSQETGIAGPCKRVVEIGG